MPVIDGGIARGHRGQPRPSELLTTQREIYLSLLVLAVGGELCIQVMNTSTLNVDVQLKTTLMLLCIDMFLIQLRRLLAIILKYKHIL